MRLIGSFPTITTQGTSGSATSSCSSVRSRVGAVVLMGAMVAHLPTIRPCPERPSGHASWLERDGQVVGVLRFDDLDGAKEARYRRARPPAARRGARLRGQGAQGALGGGDAGAVEVLEQGDRGSAGGAEGLLGLGGREPAATREAAGQGRHPPLQGGAAPGSPGG